MPYVSSIERIRSKRSRASGRAEGLTEAIRAVLQCRFGKRGAALFAGAELPRSNGGLKRRLRELLEAGSLDEAAAFLGCALPRPAARP